MIFKVILINKLTPEMREKALNYLRDRLTGVCGRDITWQAKTEKR